MSLANRSSQNTGATIFFFWYGNDKITPRSFKPHDRNQRSFAIVPRGRQSIEFYNVRRTLGNGRGVLLQPSENDVSVKKQSDGLIFEKQKTKTLNAYFSVSTWREPRGSWRQIGRRGPCHHGDASTSINEKRSGPT